MSKQLTWTPQTVNAFWDGVSGSRLDELSFAKLNGSKLLNLISAWLPKEGKILDFGAGSGFLVRQLLERGYRVGAFDPSGGRESTLSSMIGSHPNFLGLEHGEGSRDYDVVIFSEVIEHILEPDYDEVLSRMTSFVKPNGILILTTPNHEDIEQKATFCPTCQQFFHPWQHVRSIEPAALVAEFSQRGFTKQFLGLIDFSDDAESVELGRITRRLIDDAERLKQDAQPESGLRLLAQRILHFLGVKSGAASTQLSRQEMGSIFMAAAEEFSLARARLGRLKEEAQPQAASATNQLIDLCIGGASTIVYVGQSTQR